jgi:two-component system nitrogen regulation sensor histidine kinase GlnL
MARQQAVKVTHSVRSRSVDDRFYRHLVSNLRTGVLAITRDGLLAVMNDIAYRSLGLPPQTNDLGRPFTEVLVDCPEVIGVLQAAFDSDDLPNRAEMRLRRTGKAIGYSLSRIYNDDGQAAGATLFFKDLTQVEQLEERERLRDRLATLGEMAAAIAHEVKNPLASIEVMAGVLRRQFRDREDAHDVDVREQLDDIIKEAKMANAIVVEVLEYVRPIQLQPESVSLIEVLAESVTMAEGKIPRGAIIMDMSVDPDVPDLTADAHQLRQMFANLIANAFEAMGGRGRVRIRARLLMGEVEPLGGTRSLPSRVRVEVHDDGPGISADDLERIFSPFFTTKPQGTGLGLAIVRKVVDAHDGTIHATSALGHGTTFTVTLPVTPIRPLSLIMENPDGSYSRR